MRLTNRHLWLADAAGDPFLLVLNRPGLSLERAIGRRGEGPGDFKAATDLSLRDGDTDGIWVFDVTTKHLTRVPDDRHLDYQTLAVLPHRIIHAVWVGQNRIVGITRSDTARFSVFDSLARGIATVRGPLLGDDSIPVAVRARISGAVKLCSRPGGGRYAVIYLAAGRIEIHDSAGTLVGLAAVPHPSNGEFVRDAQSRKWRPRAPRNFYAACAATRRHIYALFSGRNLADFTSAEASSGRYVHVFDWNGSLVRVFALDRDATTIEVSSDTMMFISSLESDTVSKVNLPVRF